MAATQRTKPEPPDKPLSPSERRFVDELLIDGNATRAYRTIHPRATYGTCRAEGSALLAKPNVAAEVKAARAALSRKAGVKADAVLRELSWVAFSDVLDLFEDDMSVRPLRDIPFEARRAVKSVRVRKERRVRRTTTTSRRGGVTVTVEETVFHQVTEVGMHDKMSALAQLGKFHGLDEGLPPLDVLLSVLPPDVADYLRGVMTGRDA